jgi:ABC-type multidrug transport system ATPase subunit
VIDEPFKTYSSGMQARLTFSTAISIDPDIFIVDEALAAGDQFFVAKCLGRIEEICRSGSTVLFVSHNLAMVERFCSDIIWLEEGGVVGRGNVHDVCKAYEEQALEDRRAELKKLKASEYAHSKESEEEKQIEIEEFYIEDEIGAKTENMVVGKSYTMNVVLQSRIDTDSVGINIVFISQSGQIVMSTASYSFISLEGHEDSMDASIQKGKNQFSVKMKNVFLGADMYFVTVGVSHGINENDSANYYDLKTRNWAISVIREGLVQNVFLEQPVAWSQE